MVAERAGANLGNRPRRKRRLSGTHEQPQKGASDKPQDRARSLRMDTHQKQAGSFVRLRNIPSWLCRVWKSDSAYCITRRGIVDTRGDVMAISRRLTRAVATNYLAQASGVTASALTNLATDRNAAMTGAASGRALVGTSAGGQSASFQIDLKPTERVELFQAAIDYLNGVQVTRTSASFTYLLDS